MTAAAVFLACCLGAALLVSHFHRRAIGEATEELQSLALMLASHTENSLQSVALLTAGVVETVEGMSIESTEQFNERLSTVAVHDQLKARSAALSQVEALFLTNAAGLTISSTRAWPTAIFSIADRPHFAALRDAPQLGSYLAPPAQNVQTGSWNIYISRPIRAPDGAFLGIAGAGIGLTYLEAFLGRVARGRSTSLAIWRHDGMLMARFPLAAESTGRSVRKTGLMFQQILGTGSSGTAIGTSAIDGKERLVAAQALTSYDVAVTVSREMPEVLSLWRRQAQFTVGALVLVAGVIGGIVILCIRHLAHRDLLERARIEVQLLEEHRRAEAEIYHLAHHDSLTGLANRTLFYTRLKDAVKLARHGNPFAVLCLDLDHFKDVNDTLGHPIGDSLLRAVTKRLHAEVRSTDTIARLGGDEFAIVQMGLGDQPRGAGMLAQRLVDALGSAFDIDGHHVVVGASIGIAVALSDGQDADQLLKNADLALYRAKASGRSCFRFFEPEMNAHAQARRKMIIDLRRALEAEELALYYQPKVDILTHEVTGFEALLRWHHPRLGLITPDRFIALAEETGIILTIGKWVLERACRDAAEWPKEVSVAVNLSPVQFTGGSLTGEVQAALAASSLDPSRLELEITESVLLRDTDATLATLHKIQALGIRIALDDFGTGYSSLGYLQRFPFSRIKIDRSFVSRLGEQEEAGAIVQSVVQLCIALKMATTAEGVETEDQCRLLAAMGCDEAQGYLFGHPQPNSVVTALMATGSSR